MLFGHVNAIIWETEMDVAINLKVFEKNDSTFYVPVRAHEKAQME